MDVLTINTIRSAGATVFFIIVMLLFGRIEDLSQLSLFLVVLLIGSSIIGLGIGDTLYFRSMGLIGVSRSYPMTNIAVIFTSLAAFVFLKESISWLIIVGGTMIISGVYLIAGPAKGNETTRIGTPAAKIMLRGTLLVVVASVLWAFSIIASKIAVDSLNPLTANVVRLPTVTLLFSILYLSRGRKFKTNKFPPRSIIIILASGVIGVGIGGLLFFFAIQQAGAAKTAILFSVSPLFATAISLIFLKEKINLRIGLGILLSVAGVWFVV